MFTNALVHAKLYSVNQLPCVPHLVEGLRRLTSQFLDICVDDTFFHFYNFFINLFE